MGKGALRAMPTATITTADGGHASAFALRATADKPLCPPYEINQPSRPDQRFRGQHRLHHEAAGAGIHHADGAERE